jgi:hypothetical protein
VFWVISVYFNIRNTLPKYGTFLLGHPVYTARNKEKNENIVEEQIRNVQDNTEESETAPTTIHVPTKERRDNTHQVISSVPCAGLLDVQNISSADTGVSRPVSVTPSTVVQAPMCSVLCLMTRVNQCPISLRSEHPLHYIK